MNGKRLRSNKIQTRILVDFMSTNPYMAAGEFTGPLGSRRVEAQWLKLKDLLKKYGPDKSIDQWKQTWKDLKKQARHENALQSTLREETGNVAVVPIVSENTKKILDTIGHHSSTGVGPAESVIGSFSGEILNEMVVDSTPNFLPSYCDNTVSLSLPPLPHSLGFVPEDEENIPPSFHQTPSHPHSSRSRPSRSAATPKKEVFAELQRENNAILQNIATLMAEKNQLLREQNQLLAEANEIAKKNSYTEHIGYLSVRHRVHSAIFVRC